jgi:hypothetical protein
MFNKVNLSKTSTLIKPIIRAAECRLQVKPLPDIEPHARELDKKGSNKRFAAIPGFQGDLSEERDS